MHIFVSTESVQLQPHFFYFYLLAKYSLEYLTLCLCRLQSIQFMMGTLDYIVIYLVFNVYQVKVFRKQILAKEFKAVL